jgi:ribosomal protein S18 acetylase RimI-like enzyme
MTSPPRDAIALSLIRDLAIGAEAELTVEGGCMSPQLRDGDVVTVRRAASAAVGDVVAIATSRGPRVHRVIRTTDSELETAGDRSAVGDGAHPWSELIGVVVSARRGSRPLAIDGALWRAYGLARAALQRHPRAFGAVRAIRRAATDRVLFSEPIRRLRARLLGPLVVIELAAPERDEHALLLHHRRAGFELPRWLPTRWRAAEEPLRVFVARRGSRIIASLVASPFFKGNARVFWIGEVLVDRAWQGAGIGRRLLQFSVDSLRRTGEATGGFTAEVAVENERSLGLFRSLGFAVEGETPDDMGDRVPRRRLVAPA